MNFIDEAIITVQSGDGGRGCVSFRREKFIPRGGPDGGDGGKGGDVAFVSSARKRTLYQFKSRREWRAGNGRPGQGKQRTGKSGNDLSIEIPPGTIVSDAATGLVAKDFTQSGVAYTIAHGGRGGQGNRRFRSSTNRSPRFAQPGEPGKRLSVKLELKLLADVGIVGLPNAGKSTLISIISSARPKIGDYPFTTLTPNLGVVRWGDHEPFVIADIPGLVAGAHEGAGLGTRFLRHIERTRILVHLIDVMCVDPDAPLDSYNTINHELSSYSRILSEKPQIVALNKLDMEGGAEAADAFTSAGKGLQAVSISALTGQGLERLKTRIARALDMADERE